MFAESGNITNVPGSVFLPNEGLLEALSLRRDQGVVFRVGSFAIALLVTLFYLFLVMFLLGVAVGFCLRAMVVVSFFIAGVALALFLRKCLMLRCLS
ncbi:hypothetical protein [Chlamydiifrater volucris]|uniref:hypothetical protein n=1 Tax=Chlamydiifrater volucris TaxID=2681470 RepID=UPI001BCE9547|nr:hypothetical protein [Chlamydiifrater volucris]